MNQQVSIKVTATMVLAAVAVTALFFNQKIESQSHESEVNQFLSAANKTINESSHQNKAKSTISLPAVSSMPTNHPPLNGNSAHSVSSGPEEDFLQVPDNIAWQPLKQGEGVASLKYQLQLDNEQQEMAVIRMNKEVPLDTVVNIWKQKAGLASDASIKYEPFTNNHQQSMYLTELKGPFKTILLAIHKDKKYTFFRLTGKTRDDVKALTAFKEFLSQAKIES